MEETYVTRCQRNKRKKRDGRMEPLLRSCASAMRSGELMHQKSFGLVRSDVGGGNYGPEDGRGCGGAVGAAFDDKTTTTTTTTTKRPMMVSASRRWVLEEMKTIADMVVARENSWHVVMRCHRRCSRACI